MDDVFVYFVDLPDRVHEMVASGYDGYTIYIDDRLDKISQCEALYHAMHHIEHNDFEKSDVDKIEHDAHGGMI